MLQDLGEMKGDLRAEGLEPLGEPGKRMKKGWNLKGHNYSPIAYLGGIV